MVMAYGTGTRLISYVPAETKQALEAEAARRGVTVGYLVREVLYLRYGAPSERPNRAPAGGKV